MSDPLGWELEHQGEWHPVFLKELMNSRDGLLGEPFHWSSDLADELLDKRGDSMFAYSPNTRRLRLITVAGNSEGALTAECTCPDTWEEALAWLRMTCELAQT